MVRVRVRVRVTEVRKWTTPSFTSCPTAYGMLSITGVDPLGTGGTCPPQSSGWGDANGFVPPKVELCS